MSKLQWGKTSERFYETGVDRGVLYVMDLLGNYGNGVAWNGLTSVTESPSGAEANKQYADNSVYLNLLSAEEFGGTIEAFTYPAAFGQCDGTAEPIPGVTVSQQNRRAFGFSWRTLIGNDVVGTDYGYKLHLAYGAQASPSEKANATINDSPEAVALSWEFTTTPVPIPNLKPAAHLTINSTRVSAGALADLEAVLYGSAGTEPRMPSPEEVFALVGTGGAILATPVKPANTGAVITIPATTGVVYTIDNVVKPAGVLPAITKPTIVKAYPAKGYKFADGYDDDWAYTVT